MGRGQPRASPGPARLKHPQGLPVLRLQHLGQGLLLSSAQGPHPPGGRDAGGRWRAHAVARPLPMWERDQRLLDAQFVGG